MTVTRDLFALWSWPFQAMKFGSDIVETIVGAQSVIAARLPVVEAALRDPLNADRQELGRMVAEKVSAFRTSGKSVGEVGGKASAAAAANAKAVRTMASGGLLWPKDWIRLLETNLAAAAALSALPVTALAPIHKGVVANDRRLRASAAA